MVFLQIHDVVSVELLQVVNNVTQSGDKFVTRAIVITDKNGRETKVNLFADNATNVSIEV